MNRRQFLHTCAATATAAAITPTDLFAADGAPATTPPPPQPKPRIPIGFLGATYSHGPAKIKLTLNSPDWELVGVCDSTDAGRKTCAELGAKLITQEELFAKAKVVAVESDVRDHAAHAMLVLKAGKHLHLEKPAATKLSEIQAIVALAREKKLLLQSGYMWRYHPGFAAIIDAVRQGWLGDVFMVRGYVANNLPGPRRPEWAEFPGGSMFELGSHLVDATVRLLGKPKGITPFLRKHGKFDDTLKDTNVAVLDYEKATAVLINTALQAGATPQRMFEVLGTNGTATLQPIEAPILAMDLAKPAGPYKKGSQLVPLPPYQRYNGDFAELAAAIRGEKPLSISLDDELLIGETVLRVAGMA